MKVGQCSPSVFNDLFVCLAFLTRTFREKGCLEESVTLFLVALSSVQEDNESLRVVRRVETSQRHPPAVSEEDLSVASLLDIPSWAEAMGNAHSESIHGDLMEELEISQ